jgi:hypothetical protein
MLAPIAANRASPQPSPDTAWFSILDSEWPAIKTAFESWLAPENFDAEGRQRMRLSLLTAAAYRS